MLLYTLTGSKGESKLRWCLTLPPSRSTWSLAHFTFASFLPPTTPLFQTLLLFNLPLHPLQPYTLSFKTLL